LLWFWKKSPNFLYQKIGKEERKKERKKENNNPVLNMATTGVLVWTQTESQEMSDLGIGSNLDALLIPTIAVVTRAAPLHPTTLASASWARSRRTTPSWPPSSSPSPRRICGGRLRSFIANNERFVSSSSSSVFLCLFIPLSLLSSRSWST